MATFQDISGRRFGKLIVLRVAGRTRLSGGRSVVLYECRCDCGTVKTIPRSQLDVGGAGTRSCGCTHNAMPIEQHLLSRLDRSESGCWNWTGGRNGKYEYGSLSKDGKCLKPHRTAYELWVGSIPDGMFVLHKCDNGLCCNPAHLFLGTQADNMEDCAEKGRTCIGEKNSQAKLTDSQVEEIRTRYAAGGILQRELADEFSVSTYTILRIVNNKSRTRPTNMEMMGR